MALSALIRLTAQDPKVASESDLLTVIDNQDYIPESQLMLVREELERRGNYSVSSYGEVY